MKVCWVENCENRIPDDEDECAQCIAYQREMHELAYDEMKIKSYEYLKWKETCASCCSC